MRVGHRRGVPHLTTQRNDITIQPTGGRPYLPIQHVVFLTAFRAEEAGAVMLVVALGVVLTAGVMTGMTGFGFSVLSVPLLIPVYRPHEVVVIVLCLVPITSLMLLLTPHLRGRIRVRMCGELSALSLLGLPIGVLFFRHFGSFWLTILIALILIGFAVISLFSPAEWQLPGSMVVPSGILGGLLATSTGLSGPAVAIYVHGRRLAHDELVATMAAYVGLVSVLGLAVLAFEGQIPSGPLRHVLPLTPAALLGVGIGRWWARKNHATIERMALVALGLMGCLTLLRVLA
jgi:uncharacterized protein